jgi:O-glycosyl hydrolase
MDAVSLGAFEDAAFQALVFLQDLYGFTIVDYSYQTMDRHRQFMRQLFRIANQGVQLARIVIDTSDNRFSPDIDTLNIARHLVQDVDSMAVLGSNVPHL